MFNLKTIKKGFYSFCALILHEMCCKNNELGIRPSKDILPM